MDFLIKKLKNIKVWISIIITFFVFALIISKLDYTTFSAVLKQSNPFLFIAAIMVYFTVFPVLALRWKLLLKNIKIKSSFAELTGFIFLQWFVNSIIPAKLGDLYKAHLVKKYQKTSMSKVLGTILVERMFDIVVAALLFITSAYIVFSGLLPNNIILPIKIIISAVLVAIAIAIIIFRANFIKLKLIPLWFKEKYVKFKYGFSKSVRLKDILYLVVLSFLSFLTQIVGIYLITLSMNLNITFFQAVFITMASAFITLIPLTPAGAGVSELAVAGIFIMIGVDEQLAISAAVLLRAYYWCLVLFGSIYYISTPKK